ncbi:hypothetical protein [Mesorhizobium sp. dw_380]|uniref:hypothetical protein n=1 Tax=Mesorhizobium sp. dw_380 TaxID=2812001 RepID=UPI001BDE6794|nr:hypothetical protein [Mesorhizobium sp. dw_380]
MISPNCMMLSSNKMPTNSLGDGGHLVADDEGTLFASTPSMKWLALCFWTRSFALRQGDFGPMLRDGACRNAGPPLPFYSLDAFQVSRKNRQLLFVADAHHGLAAIASEASDRFEPGTGPHHCM